MLFLILIVCGLLIQIIFLAFQTFEIIVIYFNRYLIYFYLTTLSIKSLRIFFRLNFSHNQNLEFIMSKAKTSENNLVRRSIFTSDLKSNETRRDDKDTASPPSSPTSSTMTTAYDWESDKRRSKPTDDGTMTFFWRAHTITCLIIAMSYLVYVALFEQTSEDSNYNTKRFVITKIEYSKFSCLDLLYFFQRIISMCWIFSRFRNDTNTGWCVLASSSR